MNRPEELERAANVRRECENCHEQFMTRAVNQKYCANCRPEITRQYNTNYYATKGAAKRKSIRRKLRAERDAVPRPCCIPACTNSVYGVANKKFCKECKALRNKGLSVSEIQVQRVGEHAAMANDATQAETQRDSTETNDSETPAG